MARQVTVITPENIPITLELAGLGTRFGALLVDFLWQALATALVLFATLMVIVFAGGAVALLRTFIPAIAILAAFCIVFGYFWLFEAIWNGQTPGKRAFGLRVVRDGGYPVGFFAAAARNLVRIVDFLPLFYGIGSISMFAHGEHKRLGDFVAGTIVIKERGFGAVAQPFDIGANANTNMQARLPDGVLHPLDVLTDEELALLRRFAGRRWQMTPDNAERLAYRLAAPLVPRFQITFAPDVPPRYADILSTIVAVADQPRTTGGSGTSFG